MKVLGPHIWQMLLFKGMDLLSEDNISGHNAYLLLSVTLFLVPLIGNDISLTFFLAWQDGDSEPELNGL